MLRLTEQLANNLSIIKILYNVPGQDPTSLQGIIDPSQQRLKGGERM